MRLRPPRRSRRLAALLLAVALGSAAAHPMLVIGEVAFEPDPPAPGAEALVTLTLQETSLAEVEDAVVFLELRPGPPPAGDSTPVGPPLIATDRLEEVSPGVYQASLTLPADGAYTLSVRDRTYRQEEAVANLVLTFSDQPLGAQPFVLPPTRTGPASLGTWLVWLIGVPLAAGVLVTILVLRGGGRSDEEDEPEAG